MYSSTAIGRELADIAYEYLKLQNCFLLVVGIGTDDNDSDSPTRGDVAKPAFSSQRLRNSYLTAIRALEGTDRRVLNPNVMLGSHQDSDSVEEDDNKEDLVASSIAESASNLMEETRL